MIDLRKTQLRERQPPELATASSGEHAPESRSSISLRISGSSMGITILPSWPHRRRLGSGSPFSGPRAHSAKRHCCRSRPGQSRVDRDVDDCRCARRGNRREVTRPSSDRELDRGHGHRDLRSPRLRRGAVHSAGARDRHPSRSSCTCGHRSCRHSQSCLDPRRPRPNADGSCTNVCVALSWCTHPRLPKRPGSSARPRPTGPERSPPRWRAALWPRDRCAGVEDHEGNQTRFVLMARDVLSPPTGHDRTTLVCFQQADRPGSLHQILGQFAARKLNLTKV